MNRITHIEPAFDCICGPCNRPDCPGHGAVGDLHGRGNVHWNYAIVADDGRTALSFAVYTSISLPCTPDWIRAADEGRRRKGERPRASDLTLHCDFITDSDGAGSNPKGCIFLAGRPCHADYTTSIAAGHFWEKHGEPGALLPERCQSFWLALEAEFRVRDQSARGRRVKQCTECPPTCAHCKGTEFVADPF